MSLFINLCIISDLFDILRLRLKFYIKLVLSSNRLSNASKRKRHYVHKIHNKGIDYVYVI